jgi:DNA-binding winged helix-turn-helix (wHTH) protein
MNGKTNHFYEFGPFRFNLEEHALFRDGEPVNLPPRVSETLSLLLENAGHLVEKDTLIKEVWKDAIVEEGNLNKNIFILRKTLGQWNGGREYIETVPKRGYRFVGTVTETTSESLPVVANIATIPRHKPRLRWAGVFITVMAVAVPIWFLLPAAPPRVNAVTQITHDGFPIAGMQTDGVRIYFNQYRPEGLVVAQVSISGGETSIVPTPMPNMWIADISADHSQLLMGSPAPESGSEIEVPLWAVPLPSGSPHRLGNIVGASASWSPDGQQMAFVKGSDLYLAKADGTSPHLLVSLSGYPNFGSFSPDSRRIRFTLTTEAHTLSLWEVRTDGSNLHQLLPTGTIHRANAADAGL